MKVQMTEQEATGSSPLMLRGAAHMFPKQISYALLAFAGGFLLLAAAGLSMVFFQYHLEKTKLTSLGNAVSEMRTAIIRLEEESSNNLQKVSESIVNQTTLFNRALGKLSPVIVPEEYRDRLSRIEAKCQLPNLPSSKDALNTLERDYRNYISNTPPWIQEEQSSRLINIRYIIVLAKIAAYYASGEASLDEVQVRLEELLETMPVGIDEKSIEEAETLLAKVQREINNAEESQNKVYLAELASRARAYVSSPLDFSDEEVEGLLVDLEEHENESVEVKSLLSNAITTYQQVFKERELESLRIELNGVIETSENGILDELRASELRLRLEASREISPLIADMIQNLDLTIERSAYLGRLKNIKERFNVIRSFSNHAAQPTLLMLASEASTLLVDLELAKSISFDEKQEVQTILGEMNIYQQNAIEIAFQERQNQEKTYNSWALAILESCRLRRMDNKNQTGLLKDKGKDWYRISIVELFNDLLQIDPNVLNDPVRSMYSEVFQEMMSDLEPAHKLAVSKNSLKITKKQPWDI